MHERTIKHNAVIMSAGASFGAGFSNGERDGMKAELGCCHLENGICILEKFALESLGSMFGIGISRQIGERDPFAEKEDSLRRKNLIFFFFR